MLGPRCILACVALVFLARCAHAFSVEETEYIVEVMAVLDEPAVEKWLKRDGADTKEDIVEQITAMFFEVDLIYQSFRANGINIRVRLFDVHFAEGSIFEGKMYGDSGNKIATETGLYTFGGYLYDADIGYYVNDQLSGPDHSIFFTASDIDGATGVAWMDQLCSVYWSVSLVEADFFFDNVKTAAHELGHSLDLDHDGSSCQDKKYVMYSSRSPGAMGRWFFSPCSSDQLYKELDRRGDDSCMSRSSRDPIVSPRMGELLTADLWCKRTGAAMAHPDKNPPDSICKQLVCWDGYYTTWTSSTSEGMECDDGKRCFMGYCLSLEID